MFPTHTSLQNKISCNGRRGELKYLQGYIISAVK